MSRARHRSIDCLAAAKSSVTSRAMNRTRPSITASASPAKSGAVGPVVEARVSGRMAGRHDHLEVAGDELPVAEVFRGRNGLRHRFAQQADEQHADTPTRGFVWPKRRAAQPWRSCGRARLSAIW